MSGYQRFIAVGNLTKDAESRMVGENEVCKYGIAVNGFRDSVEFFDCEQWKPGGVTEYLVKGTCVLIEGEFQTQTWKKDGEDRSRRIVKVLSLKLIGSGKRKEPAMEEEFAGDFK